MLEGAFLRVDIYDSPGISNQHFVWHGNVFSTLPWLGMTNMMSLKLSWYIGVGPTRSNDYLTMVDSKNAWNILLLFLGVSKNWGFLTLAVGFKKKEEDMNQIYVCIFGCPSLLWHIQIMVPEAVPTWPQLAAVIPTLNVPGRCSRLDGIQGGWLTRRFRGFFLPSCENTPIPLR